MTLGEQVRVLRSRCGMTQSELALHLGKSTGWLQALERDRSRISYPELVALAELLGSGLSVNPRGSE